MKTTATFVAVGLLSYFAIVIAALIAISSRTPVGIEVKREGEEILDYKKEYRG
jgi:hypothetical protein